jgi:group II intron reverse transcriptase/maturase
VDGFRTVCLGNRGNPLPNRACKQKVLTAKKQLLANWSVQVDKVRAKLPELQLLWHSRVGGYLNCVEIYLSRFAEGFEGSKYTPRKASLTKSLIKEVKREPKSMGSSTNATSGFAKGGNAYANRGLVLAVNQFGVFNDNRRTIFSNLNLSQRSRPVLTQFRQASTGTGSSSNVRARLNDLHTRSKTFPNTPIDRDLYKSFILNRDMFLVAYNKLKSNKGMMTPGISPMTLDGISLVQLDTLINKLKSESFSFSPGRKICIDKPDGGKRQLTVSSPIDKLVQEVIRMVLEAIYDPLFKDTSHGFRPNRSCHSALRQIFTKFKGCAWWIEGDIKGCFDNIPHDKLMCLLSNKIKDQRFLQLIRKALNAGYLLGNRLNYDIVGIPQGSIISPILANIYLHQLDEFVEKIKKEFDAVLKIRKRTSEARSSQWKLKKAKLSNADPKTLRKLAVSLRNVNNKRIGSYNQKLMYIRYADDWIIAVNGSYTQSKEIRQKVTDFCSTIGFSSNVEKTKITNTYKTPALFLGTNIAHSRSVTLSVHKGGFKQRNSGFLVLRTPMDRVYAKLRETGFMKNHLGVTRVTWLHLEVRQIIQLANSIIRGYENYYSFVHNKGHLCTYIYYIIRDVVLRTLANKLSLKTRAKVISKYGSEIKVFDQENRDSNNKPTLKTKLYKPSYRLNVWDFRIKSIKSNIIGLYAKDLSLARLDNLVCIICNSDYKVEMHHIRMMKDLKHIKGTLDYLMIKAKRKQIPLCRSCHMAYHSGKLTLPSYVKEKKKIFLDNEDI